ncbi:MAG TPA: ABC transporter permease [Gaiellaceae bacterium]|nr:ABC transporter permease [Gaiellaceae bacterium]
MFRYLIRRVLWAAVLFVAVTIVTYIIFFITPADPAKLVAGRGATEADIERARKFIGLDDPVPVQYWHFLSRLMPISFVDGPHLKEPSLGFSFATRQDVNDIVMAAAPVTASLVFGGAIAWMLVSVPVGILSALRPRSLFDRAAMTFVLIGVSAHPVWIGLIFAYFFGYKWGEYTHLPITGYAEAINPSTAEGGPVEWFRHMILPWATFAMLFSALYVRMIRANVMETMNEDYVRTARAKGAPESVVLRSHILRNAMLPVVTILGMDIGLALGGAIFTESVYSLPGLGNMAIRSIENLDLPVTQGIVVFATLAVITFNLIVDLLYAVIDPRIRLE